MTAAWADHGVGLRSAGLSPLVEVLFWAGLAALVGLVAVAIVNALSYPRRPNE